MRARGIVEGRFFTQLTPRQRAVVAWRATGAGMWETARRTGSFPSVVRDHLIAAFWRVERLTWEAEYHHAPKIVPIPEFDTGLLEIEDLLGRSEPDSTGEAH